MAPFEIFASGLPLGAALSGSGRMRRRRAGQFLPVPTAPALPLNWPDVHSWRGEIDPVPTCLAHAGPSFWGTRRFRKWLMAGLSVVLALMLSNLDQALTSCGDPVRRGSPQQSCTVVPQRVPLCPQAFGGHGGGERGQWSGKCLWPLLPLTLTWSHSWPGPAVGWLGDSA